MSSFLLSSLCSASRSALFLKGISFIMVVHFHFFFNLSRCHSYVHGCLNSFPILGNGS